MRVFSCFLLQSYDLTGSWYDNGRWLLPGTQSTGRHEEDALWCLVAVVVWIDGKRETLDTCRWRDRGREGGRETEREREGGGERELDCIL